MANYFVAFVLDDYPELLPSLVPTSLRLFNKQDLHCTIAFLGAMEARLIPEVCAVALRIQSSTISCRVRGLRLLPNAEHFSAVSWDFTEGAHEIQTIQRRWRDELCDAAHAPRDQREPLAHCTIGRPKAHLNRTEKHRIAAWAAEQHAPERELIIRSLALYTKAEPGSGQLFQKLEEWTLSR